MGTIDVMQIVIEAIMKKALLEFIPEYEDKTISNMMECTVQRDEICGQYRLSVWCILRGRTETLTDLALHAYHGTIKEYIKEVLRKMIFENMWDQLISAQVNIEFLLKTLKRNKERIDEEAADR